MLKLNYIIIFRMLVQKFGGTSLGSLTGLTKTLKIIQQNKEEKVVVVSAFSGVTNELIQATKLAVAGKRTAVKKILDEILARHFSVSEKIIAAPQLRQEVQNYCGLQIKGLSGFLKAIGEIGELSQKSRDTILAVGEKLSSFLLAGILTANSRPAIQVNLEKIIPPQFCLADRNFYLATEKIFARKLRKILQKKLTPIVTGYFGKVPGGMLENVGRGYSDFCASLVAVALKAKRLEIWTDVSGIYTADPNKIKKARVIPEILGATAAELAHFGAKVLHPQSINPAIRAQIPVQILNTFDSKAKGTVILKKLSKSAPKKFFTAITAKKGVTIVNIISSRMLLQHGYLAQIFAIFAKHEVPIDVVSTSEISVSVVIEKIASLKKIESELRQFAKVQSIYQKAIICLLSSGTKNQAGVAGKIFTLLGKTGISLEQISQGASEINITFVVAENDADRAVQILHKNFLEN